MITSVGRSIHTYGGKRLDLLTASPAHDSEIACLAGDSDRVYSACENVIFSWLRGTELDRTYEGHESKVVLLLPFGKHLLSVDEGGRVVVWDVDTTAVYLELFLDAGTFRATAVLHPVTYVNKVLFGSEQGTLQLWNVRTGNLVYTFAGWGSAVTALEQSTAVDVAAVGLASGQVVLHDLRSDRSIVKFSQEWGPVTAISFRTDGQPLMATGSPPGHVAVWDLEKGRLHCQLQYAHGGSVTGLRFLPQEPLLLTSSDNSLRVWAFDETDGGGRLLRQRQGHGAPPCKIRFHGASGASIISAGLDSTLRCFSTVGDNLNRSLGVASYDRQKAKKRGVARDPGKMPPIVEFASEATREKEWDSIVACHRGLGAVTTWTGARMGKHRLLHERFRHRRDVTAQCVSLSSCGNFVTVGYSSGHVDRFNVQSGIHRRTYGEDGHAHEGPVRGVASDSLNQLVVTGGGDGRIRFWAFKDGRSLRRLELGTAVSKMELHRESGMLAVATDTFAVCVVDVELRRVVRTFASYYSQVTDMAFSPDARWLVTASADALLRTWDLPSGRLVDCFRVPSACTSLSMSPAGDYLATAHADDLGVYLWSNVTLYSRVTLGPLSEDHVPETARLPSGVVRGLDLGDDPGRHASGVCLSDAGASEERTDDAEIADGYDSPEQISDRLVTLSSLPYSRWQNLLNVDVIKQRNRPRQPPRAPKAAPFFIPTSAGLDPKFVLPEREEGGTRILSYGVAGLSPFGKLVNSCADTGNYSPLLEKLKEMGPSTIDFEVRSLAPESGGTTEVLLNFARAMLAGLQSRKDYELVQSYLGIFLKVHADTVTSEPALCDALRDLSEVQRSSWKALETLFDQSLCVVSYLRSAIL